MKKNRMLIKSENELLSYYSNCPDRVEQIEVNSSKQRHSYKSRAIVPSRVQTLSTELCIACEKRTCVPIFKFFYFKTE